MEIVVRLSHTLSIYPKSNHIRMEMHLRSLTSVIRLDVRLNKRFITYHLTFLYIYTKELKIKTQNKQSLKELVEKYLSLSFV